ncbi:MAG: ABC transporter permease [Candidatus Thermoplasmatota archaeon]|nr:ABC transporter permease [Candidatus Thermoplasmatota archaeon]MCL5731384.1 ABC transporter permease [Candidatus Thermoplasmatota archaeon]
MNLKFTLLFAWYYGFNTILRGPSYLIAALSTPMTLLFLVYVLSHGTLLAFAVVGGFVSLISTISLSSASDAAFLRIQLRFQDLFVPTRTGPTEYMIGLTLSYLVFSIPGIAIYAIFGYFLHIMTAIRSLEMAGLLIVLVVSTASVSFIISGLIKHIRNVWGIAAILSIVMTILPPTFYPYVYLPKWALYILSVSPSTPAAVIAQWIFGLSPALPIMIPVLVVESLVFFSIARFMTRWREN